MIKQEYVRVEKASYIYRCVHRIMEGDCQCEHGPIQVEIGPIEAQKYCVTNGMYYEFIKESGYHPENPAGFLKHWVNGKYLPEDEDLPVTNVSVEDAKAYAAFYGMRLPTQQEWQYLAAGPKHLAYPWGNEKDYSKCNVFGDKILPVNALPEGVSPFGLYNMCGNVWEFTSEVYCDAAADHHHDHRFICLRGGSYYSAPNYWHAEKGAIKNDAHLKVHLLGGGMDRYETAGFRCVREVK